MSPGRSSPEEHLATSTSPLGLRIELMLALTIRRRSNARRSRCSFSRGMVCCITVGWKAGLPPKDSADARDSVLSNTSVLVVLFCNYFLQQVDLISTLG
jgi:hypothetical protein